MPLPANNTPWPPPEHAHAYKRMREHSAWYSGDTSELLRLYGATTNPIQVQDHVQSYRGGLINRLSRFFWGQPQSTQLYSTKLHVPIAADLCQATADLLYAEPPQITLPEDSDAKSADRLAELIDDGVHTLLAESAELGGALGDSYIRVVWDRTVEPDRPFLATADADGVIPMFRWGRLVSAMLWYVVASDDKDIWRHLELHELDAGGIGVITHGLYCGDADNLGRLVPLTEQPATAGLATLVNDLGQISTESPGLAVERFPNQTPQRKHRGNPQARHLGRSVLDGVEPLMDGLDEVYSSLMRDIRQGKGRVFVQDSMLDKLPGGKGSAFDMDREIFAPLHALQQRDPSGNGLPIQSVQFAIRVAEHIQAMQQLVEDILRTSGFSSQTFGEAEDGGSATATEIQARQQRTFLTRDRQIRLHRPALARIMHKLMWVDSQVFRSGINPMRPDVTFADGVQESTLTLAQTAQALRTAEAASTETLVQMVHPDWDETQVQAEVEAIKAESPAAQIMADPTTTGGGSDAGQGDDVPPNFTSNSDTADHSDAILTQVMNGHR